MTTSATWGTRRCCEQPLFEMGWNDVVGNIARAEGVSRFQIYEFCHKLLREEIPLPREDALYKEGVHTAAGQIIRNETTEYMGPDWVVEYLSGD